MRKNIRKKETCLNVTAGGELNQTDLQIGTKLQRNVIYGQAYRYGVCDFGRLPAGPIDREKTMLSRI